MGNLNFQNVETAYLFSKVFKYKRSTSIQMQSLLKSKPLHKPGSKMGVILPTTEPRMSETVRQQKK